jgi:hypothetical protein
MREEIKMSETNVVKNNKYGFLEYCALCLVVLLPGLALMITFIMPVLWRIKDIIPYDRILAGSLYFLASVLFALSALIEMLYIIFSDLNRSRKVGSLMYLVFLVLSTAAWFGLSLFDFFVWPRLML